tara:strand:+ start:440 stop:922 length:483 start_codon:yes stop_codon:yes gene_type:complete
MPLDLILPICFLFSFIAYGFIAKWYALPALRKITPESALVILILPHTFRYIGLSFLIPGVTASPLPTTFANPTAYGDLLSAVLAFIAIYALRTKRHWANPAIWVFNIVGTADLIVAVSIGTYLGAVKMMGSTFFIPAILVPFLLVSHALIFRLLTNPKTR